MILISAPSYKKISYVYTQDLFVCSTVFFCGRFQTKVPVVSPVTVEDLQVLSFLV